MMLPERTGDQVRIGVALAVPEPFGSRLQDARARSGDPLAHAIPPHVTLLGPTVLGPSDLAAAVAHLGRVAGGHQPFTLHLRGTGTFRPVSPVVFVRVLAGGAQCADLERDVRSGPLDQPLRFHYHPHVTVAHDVPEEALDRASAELAGFEARFDVDALQVFEHGDDGVWRVVHHIALAV